MNNLFRMDSPVFLFMGHVADLLVLNFIFLLCCIPVVTIGPSVTALYYVALKIAAKEDVYVTRSFFRSFRRNVRQGVLLWLILILVGGLLAFDLYSLRGSVGSVNSLVRTVTIALAILYVMTALYTFPILARFENTIAGTLRLAVLLAIVHFPSAALMVLLSAAAVFLTLLSATTIRYGLFVWLTLGFSLLAWAQSFLLNRIFSSLTPRKPES